MFRIDRNLVKLTPLRYNPIMETVEQPVPEEQEVPVDSQADFQPEDELTPEEPPPEPEPEPEPAGPTPEELAQQRADEIIAQAEQQATKLTQSAQRQADELLRKAEEEAESLREAARAEGFESGAEKARQEAMAELEVKKNEDDELLRGVIDVIHGERVRMQGELEGEVIKLTLAIAEKIIKLASENDDKVFESMIVNALKEMNLEGKLTIRVGVREYDRFFSSGSAVFALGDGTTVTASVVKDPMLADGDLIIDSDSGTVNAGIDSQLRYIELAFNGAEGV